LPKISSGCTPGPRGRIWPAPQVS